MITGIKRIESAVRLGKAEGHPAITAFLTAGFPKREGFAPSVINSSRPSTDNPASRPPASATRAWALPAIRASSLTALTIGTPAPGGKIRQQEVRKSSYVPPEGTVGESSARRCSAALARPQENAHGPLTSSTGPRRTRRV